MDLKSCGLPLKYENNKLMSKDKDFFIPKPDIRTLKQAKPFLMEDVNDKDRAPLYYMYRDVHFKKNEKLLKRYHLRYDITIIPARMNGKEFNKTIGHVHSFVKKKKVTYTEVYEVLSGEALFFLQKMKGNKVSEVRAYLAKKDDKVIVPPGFAHITINPGKKVLMMANWMCTDSKSDYTPIKKRHGAVYYYIDDGKKVLFVKNRHYKSHPSIRLMRASEKKGFGLFKKKHMYQSCIENPSRFDFLIHPEMYCWEE